MRSDMDRVVTERPRARGGVRRPKGERKELAKQLGDHDRTGRKQMLERRWSNDHLWRKEFTDVLGPLKNYALSVVGRPWAKVYSEISRVLSIRAKATFKVKAHARDHLWQYLVPPWKVIVQDGKSYRRLSLINLDPDKRPGVPIYDDEAYADPNDGIIKRGTFKRKRYRPKNTKITVVKDGRHFKVIKGVWYEIRMEDVPEKAWEFIPSHTEILSHGATIFYRGQLRLKRNFLYDMFLGDLFFQSGQQAMLKWRLKRTYGVEKYAVAKRQLNSKEIRRLGLPKQY